ncbi:MAG: SMODS domain-containing nucleotidyltransferase [Gemmatimonadaceae bacterium]
MATLNSLFEQFLSNIEPDAETRAEAIKAHEPVRDWLASHDSFGAVHVETFLAGSYRRRTSITPIKDVDIVVVCAMSEYDPQNPKKLLAKLKSALDDNKKYRTRTSPRRRSIQIELSKIDMDIVPTVAPNGVNQPLLIPDRDLTQWFPTNPKGHISWTQTLNANTQTSDSDRGRFVPLVKMARQWKRVQISARHPKGHMMELMAGYYHDAAARDWADVFIAWVERTTTALAIYRQTESTPSFPDPGLPGEMIKTGMEQSDFNRFYDALSRTLPKAKRARDLAATDLTASADLWRQIFGDAFPPLSEDDRKVDAPTSTIARAPSALARPDIREAPTFG